MLEAQFPETTRRQPELLAHHYTEAGLLEKAVPYWQHAGQRAIERSAHTEAISHLTKGLALLRCCQKHLNVSNERWTCTSPWEHHCLPPKATRRLKLARSTRLLGSSVTIWKTHNGFSSATWFVEL